MQVQLIVAESRQKGQVIPVNAPSFKIGRAEGCNLRSRNAKVSRHHCTIQVSDNTVVIEDLGGENGTFVNGNKVSSVQKLSDGDKLTVGTHHFIVSIKAALASPASDQGDFFELASASTTTAKRGPDVATAPFDPMETVPMEPKKTEQEPEIMFEVRLDNQRVSVSKNRLFDLARRGSILPDDLVVVAGTKVFADSIQGIVFGNQTSAPPPAPSATTSNSKTPSPVSPAVAAVPALDSAFGFQDASAIADEVIASGGAQGERTIRIARRESAFSALWKALDISFSRVYAIEGNDLVIHSIKALYYVVVVTCMLFIFWQMFFFCKDCYDTGNLLEALSKNAVGLSVVMFGCVTIIVVVRVLLEMLLLTWVESARQDDQEKKG